MKEAIKILQEKRTTLQQILDAKVGETFDEGEAFQSEVKGKLSELQKAIRILEQSESKNLKQAHVIKSVCECKSINDWEWQNNIKTCNRCGKAM
jgi:hypothetical protein